MKKIFLGVLVLSAMILFGCARPGSPEAMGLEESFYLVARDVPYCDEATLSQFDDVELLETDDFGRQYFLYETTSRHLTSKLTIHLICQKVEDGFAFYYEDYNYIICTRDSDDLSAERVQLLKERNDWGKPLNEEKMRSTPMSGALWIGHTADLECAILEWLNLSSTEYYAIKHELGAPKPTQTIDGMVWKEEFVVQFRVCSHVDGKADGVYDRYFLALCEKNYTGFEVLVCEEFEPILDCQDLIHSFKERHLYEDDAEQ